MNVDPKLIKPSLFIRTAFSSKSDSPAKPRNTPNQLGLTNMRSTKNLVTGSSQSDPPRRARSRRRGAEEGLGGLRGFRQAAQVRKVQGQNLHLGHGKTRTDPWSTGTTPIAGKSNRIVEYRKHNIRRQSQKTWSTGTTRIIGKAKRTVRFGWLMLGGPCNCLCARWPKRLGRFLGTSPSPAPKPPCDGCRRTDLLQKQFRNFGGTGAPLISRQSFRTSTSQVISDFSTASSDISCP